MLAPTGTGLASLRETTRVSEVVPSVKMQLENGWYTNTVGEHNTEPGEVEVAIIDSH